MPGTSGGRAALSPDGTVRGLPAGAGKYAFVRGEFDGTPTTNHCNVRVLRYPVPLLPEREVRGRFISFWYPPVAMSPPPETCRFEQVVAEYYLVPTLDQVYLRMWKLTGMVPSAGWRLHLKALCEDDVFKLCGAADGDVLLGFDPLKPSSAVQLSGSPPGLGVPHWGVISHEMGHDFIGEFAALNRILCARGFASDAAFREGLASLCNMHARRGIWSRPDHYGLPPVVVSSFGNPRIYGSIPLECRQFVDQGLAPYLQKGARFPHPDQFTADVLDGMFIVLGDRYGWDIYRRFFSIFYPFDEPLDFVPTDETQRATFFVAAMSAAARTDLRLQFASWGFPCDNNLFQKLLPELTWRAAQRD